MSINILIVFHSPTFFVEIFRAKSLQSCDKHDRVAIFPSSVRYEDFLYIGGWGIKIGGRETAELIPLRDLYMVSVSYTIRGAIACGIPVINYIVYRYRYSDSISLNRVIPAEEKTGFKSVMGKFHQNPIVSNNKDQSKISDRSIGLPEWESESS